MALCLISQRKQILRSSVKQNPRLGGDIAGPASCFPEGEHAPSLSIEGKGLAFIQ